jgi:adenylate cyclase
MKKLFRAFLTFTPTSIVTGITILVLGVFLMGVPILDLLELKTYDFRLLSRGELRPDPGVVIAVIDEKSLDLEGRWPWPRAKIGDLVTSLSRDGAKVIGFDIGFLEPDENSNLKLLRETEEELQRLGLRSEGLTAFFKEKGLRADNDLFLAKAIQNAAPAVVLGYFFHMGEAASDYRMDPASITASLKRLNRSKYPLIVYNDDIAEPSHFINAYAPEVNVEALTAATPYSGYFNMRPDPDGAVRWMPLVIRCGEDIFPPLSVLCAWLYLDRPQLMVRVASYGIEGLRLGDRPIPTDENGHLLISYLGPAKTFPHYSISDILRGKLPPGTFKGKIVLIGATAIGIYDLRNTPFSPVYPGVEVHATVIDNILKGSFLSKPKWAKVYDLLATLILALISGLILSRLTALKGLLFASGLFALHIAVTRWLFVHYGVLLNMVYPLLALTLTYTGLTVYRYVTEERERKKIKGAFSYYVSESVVNEMLKHPERLKLGGDKKDLTVLFSDIRGFTTISEGLSPEALVLLLNEYLTAMTDVVFEHDGTLDKYMGDALMAIYGAPLDQPDHAAKACLSALEMIERLKTLNQKWLKEGKKTLDIGIGINTGMMMVGNMGSDQRFDYTVMGDAVNLASRLEGANKNYKTHILISEFTYARVKDLFTCMEIDSVRVKGKTKPVKIFALFGQGKAPEALEKAIAHFQEGYRHYRERNWDKAARAFEKAKATDGTLEAAGIYLRRTAELKANPPPPDWDGVFTMTVK